MHKSIYKNTEIEFAKKVTKVIRKYFGNIKFSNYGKLVKRSSVSIDLVTNNLILNESYINHPMKVQTIFSLNVKDEKSQLSPESYINRLFTLNIIGKRVFIDNDLVLELDDDCIVRIFSSIETNTSYIANCIMYVWETQAKQAVKNVK